MARSLPVGLPLPRTVRGGVPEELLGRGGCPLVAPFLDRRRCGGFVGDLSHVSTLAVVDAARPADIPIALGWAGMCNYRDRHLVGLCAVLRSWEERFGAVLVAMTFSTLVLAVAHPPRSQADAERLAAEHFAFCPDQHDPQNGIVYTPRTYGRTIRGADAWRFWWD